MIGSLPRNYHGDNMGINNRRSCPRNKYRTLTTAETTQLTKYLNSRQPTRTASVHHKPRAPPMVVTDLDDYGIHSIAPAKPPRSLILGVQANTLDNSPTDSTRKQNLRSGSSCSNRSQRHSMNLGTNYSNSLHNRNHLPITNQNKPQASPHDSESNLSFRSSLDVVDSAYGSDRLQTMSVDLGNPSQQQQQYKNNTIGYKPNYQHLNNQDKNNLHDESFSSAKSHFSETSKLKSSLSASTSKVFQNQLFNIKKFFRQMPIRRSFISGNNSNNNDQKTTSTDTGSHEDKYSLNESLSHICLNRSQSPAVCPPPPKELKSMTYMKSSNNNYSNYDEFTRARNKQTSTLLSNHARSSLRQSIQNDDCGLPTVNCEDSESWQLTSLPISFERNLTTVFEEKQIPARNSFRLNEALQNPYLNGTLKIDDVYQTVKIPNNFEDVTPIKNAASSSCSSQSLASITTTDSVLDFHRQNNSSFRFSYSQSDDVYAQVTKSNSGLPPRVPSSENKPTNSLGNSSNNSSILNGINGCETNLVNNNTKDYSSATYCLDNDNDNTIMSDTSTLNGDSNNIVYINKCSELERTIESLKNRLISKEKELTELQLKQWTSDYQTEHLKSTISKLEKENAQLKAVMKNYNRVNL